MVDVETAYLAADMEVPAYMEQPEGFKDKNRPHFVCLLRRGIYGHPAAGNGWQKLLRKIMLSFGFKAPCWAAIAMMALIVVERVVEGKESL